MTSSGSLERRLASGTLRLGLLLGVGVAARAAAHRFADRDLPGLVDWEQAGRIAERRLSAAPGRLTASQLRAIRPAYVRHMARVVPLLEVRLGAPLPGVVDRHAVASRSEWAATNLETLRSLIDHLGPLLMPRIARDSLPASLIATADRALMTRQVGFLLGYLGTRILGQYDAALLSAAAEPGRLLFVEENIRATARAIDVPLDSFRLWVCLHEATHAFEMEAHPWLRPYLRERLERQVALLAEETQRLQRRGLGHLLGQLRRAVRERSWQGFLDPGARAGLREAQAVMSLMEGFSDWVMDDVGAQLIPDVASIRRRFEERRGQRRGAVDRLVARLTGMDLKLEQYRRGEQFVSGVHALGGETAIGHLWDGPETLPTDQELDDPAAWLRRVLPEGGEGRGRT